MPLLHATASASIQHLEFREVLAEHPAFVGKGFAWHGHAEKVGQRPEAITADDVQPQQLVGAMSTQKRFELNHPPVTHPLCHDTASVRFEHWPRFHGPPDEAPTAFIAIAFPDLACRGGRGTKRCSRTVSGQA